MPISRTQIARTIFSAADSMGLSDRDQIEHLVDEVIARMERPQTLPGMEDLVPNAVRKTVVPMPTTEAIKALFTEVLEEKKHLQKEESAPPQKKEMKPVIQSTIERSKMIAPGKIQLAENAKFVLEKRYLKKDSNGKIIETAEDLFHRVANAIATAETVFDPNADAAAVAEQFYGLMSNLYFLPNSPTLMNAGRELGQLSACFVLPIEDSMESIFNAVKYTALIHKSGGGTGFSFSRLRPEKDRVGSTGGVASGPISFIRAFDTATDVIKQGGMRRGANMGILNIDHPDILNFINAKEDLVSLTNFNLSVALTEEFMEAVKAGSTYNLINPRTGEVSGTMNAKEVFDKIVDMAWKTGDPGIVFIDRINKENPTPHLGKIEATNPCGEQPLLPYESCNLGSINMAKMLHTVDGKTAIDFQKLEEVIRLAVRFLDNVIEVNRYPLEEIGKQSRSTRKIGLGVMGIADMFIQIGIPYNSQEALDAASNLMRFIQDRAFDASEELAKTRGVFPAFKGSIYDTKQKRKVRNASCTTIAPTGTLSLLASCSSGIEPVFALCYTRNILDGSQLIEVNPYFEKVAKDGGFYSEELMKRIADGEHLADITEIPEEIRRVFVTAHEITPEWHVKMQAAFQRSTDNAVSKTVNFSRDATREDIANVYLLAYEEGLKGITIYRDGSRSGQVLTTGKSEEKDKQPEPQPEPHRKPRKRPRRTTGFTEKITTGCGNLYITVNSDEEGIFEVFSQLGKAGGCASAQIEAITRLISLALRAGVDVDSIVNQLRGIRCPSIAWENGKSVLSCADAIASVLERYLSETVEEQDRPSLKDYGLSKNLAGQCPDCGNLLAYEEGCFKCPSCGYTKC